MARYNHFMLNFLFCAVFKGHVTSKRSLYISRASGDDSWSCDRTKPCKTIWRAVTLASSGDHLNLDGTNTEKDPYTCQSGNLLHPQIYINKSMSLIGFGPVFPQIRCYDGTHLTFDGTHSAQQMDVTLSRLLIHKSLLYFQDSSATINDCRFQGGEQGLKFVTGVASNIQIHNSTFIGNSECISVVANSTNNLSQTLAITVKIKNSSFNTNTLSDDGSCMSFTEYPASNRLVNYNITLDNVSFSHNNFGAKGVFFLELKNGYQNIHFQDVTYTENIPLSGRHVLAGYYQSKCIVRSHNVSILINTSTFASRTARTFNFTASYILLQIYDSNFHGHEVEGNGGVVSIRGTDHCQLKVSNSSFVNTTASQGGAFSVECAKVKCSFRGNNFTGNSAIHGFGGAVHIDAFGKETSDKGDLNSSNQTEQNLELDINTCAFNNTYSFSHGGALHINGLKSSVKIDHCTFTNCTSSDHGGALTVVSLSDKTKSASLSDQRESGIDLLLSIEHSQFKACCSGHYGGSVSIFCETKFEININGSIFISSYAAHSGGAFSIFPPPVRNGNGRAVPASHITVTNSKFLNNSAKHDGGAMCIVLNLTPQCIIIFQNVIMETNGATTGGALSIPGAFDVQIRRSRFLMNGAEAMGGALYIQEVYNILEIEDSIFDGNFAWGLMEMSQLGGALFISGITGLFSRYILISNTTFINCSTGQSGGAIYLYYEEGNITFFVNSSRFVNNLSFQNAGGGIFLSLPPDTKKDPGCMPNIQNNLAEQYPSWDYKSYVTIEDTTFQRNGARVGGAMHLTNGKATFRNCHFLDNFGTTQSSHINTMEGSASLTIQDSLFRQTIKELQLLTMNYSKTSFIHTESSGALQISNTTMDARPYGSGNPLMVVGNGRLVDLGNDNLTKIYCPVGSQIEIQNVTDQVTITVNNKPCKIEVISLSFRCLPCTGNSYSLQRGLALGSHLVPGFQCLLCPFGANCTENIFAKINFWGFKKQANPPTLRFTMCPAGYCNAEMVDFPEYNGCQGNRSGELCGHCSAGYTETLYSPHCRPSHQCNDYWFWSVALVYVSIMALYFTFKPPVVPWIKRQMLWFKRNEFEQTDQGNTFDKGYLKILFFFYQSANLFLISTSSQSLIRTNLIEPVVGLFNFKLFSNGFSCPFPGLTVSSKHYFSASHVFGTLLVICIIYSLLWGVKKIRGHGVPSAGPYIGGILQTLLLGYTTLANVSFSLLRCVPIGSESRLFYDGNVVCLQWWQYIVIASLCIFVVPFVFVLLWGSYKLYSETLSLGKFILACALPLPSLIYWSFVYLSGKINNPAVEDPSPHQYLRHFVENVLYDSFKKPEDGGKLSLSWEGVMIGRRLILILLRTFVREPLPRVLIMSTFGVLFLLHHVLTQPFRDDIANTVETISLLSIVILGMVNVFYASFLSLAVPLNDNFSSWWNVFQGVEIVILCLVPVGFGLLVITALLSQLCRLIVVVGRVLFNFCWICFRSCCSNKDDESTPLLAPVS